MVSLGDLPRRTALARAVATEIGRAIAPPEGSRPETLGVELRDVPFLLSCNVEIVAERLGDPVIFSPTGIGPVLRSWRTRPRLVGGSSVGEFMISGESRGMGGVATVLAVRIVPTRGESVEVPLPRSFVVPEDVDPCWAVLCTIEGVDHGA